MKIQFIHIHFLVIVFALISGLSCETGAADKMGSYGINDSRTSCFLIPEPKQCSLSPGVYRGPIPIPFNDSGIDDLSERSIRLAVGKHVRLKHKTDSNSAAGLTMALGKLDIESNSPQAYRLIVNEDSIYLQSPSADGILMGLRTLSQLALDGSIPQCDITDWPDLEFRAAHICYALIRETTAYNCPNFENLIAHIDQLAALKYNAVVLELEAMFPFKKHSLLSCDIAFTDDQIKKLRQRLKDHHMEIIPLVQSLGHVYYVLDHDEYAQYRETPDKIQQYCPTNPKVADFYMELVDEQLRLFPDIKRIHIGGDESRQLGDCPRCAAKVKKYGKSKLYIDYMSEIIRRLQAKGLTPIIWDDMLVHYPQAISSLPKGVQIAHWSYSTGHKANSIRMFQRLGFTVIGCPAVRYGSSGTELSVFYPHPLDGIELMMNYVKRDHAAGTLVTNWMKGSPFENTHYGFAYAGDLAWTTQFDRVDFQKRYAAVTFGLDNRDICEVYNLLSLWLPYAEPVQRHMPDKLNRFDLSGLRFDQKWQYYHSSPRRLRETTGQLEYALILADQAQHLLDRLTPRAKRGQRQLELFQMSTRCIKAKADFALMLHQGDQLEQNPDPKQIKAWLARQPDVIHAWQQAKQNHYDTLVSTGFKPSIKFLNELMFENRELQFMLDMTERLKSILNSTDNTRF